MKWPPSWTANTISLSVQDTTGAALIHQHLGSNKYAGTVRVSPGYFNTMEDIEVLLIALRNLDRSQLEGVADDILRGAC